MTNYYDIIEVDPSASESEIKQSYSRICKQIIENKRSNEHFFKILDAYNVLADNEKRRIYDKKLEEGILDYFQKEESQEEMYDEAFFQAKLLEQIALENTAMKKRRLLEGGLFALFIFVIVVFFYSIEEESEIELRGRREKLLSSRDSFSSSATIVPSTLVMDTFPAPSLATQATNDVSSGVQNLGEDSQKSVAPTVNGSDQGKVATSKKLAERKVEDVHNLVKDTDQSGKLQEKLSRQEQAEVFNSIIAEIKASNSHGSSIRVIQSENTNVENTFDIVPLLQKHGFVIAGRGFTKAATQGIKIEYRTNYSILTIGAVDVGQKLFVKRPFNKEGSKTTVVSTGSSAITEKTLSKVDLEEILHSVIASQGKNDDRTLCIEVIQSLESNIKNPFDIVPLLQEKGFVISKRGYTMEAVDKARLAHNSSCISLTIGKFVD